MIFPPDMTFFLHQPSLYWLATAESGESLSLLERVLKSNVLNIALVAIILGILAKKFNLVGGIESKRLQMTAELQAVETRKKESLAQLAEVRERTANLKAEVDAILQEAQQAAEAMSAQILTNARDEAHKIVDNAKKRVEQEQRLALKDLEKRLLTDALTDARAELAQSLAQSSSTRSVESFLDELAQMKKGGRA